MYLIKCRKCSALISSSEEICPKCGENMENSVYCSEKYCPVCGEKNSSDDKKCQYCCSII
jgi:RNA polymerase subunit RPABC4/transcription elongation factor Spt4